MQKIIEFEIEIEIEIEMGIIIFHLSMTLQLSWWISPLNRGVTLALTFQPHHHRLQLQFEISPKQEIQFFFSFFYFILLNHHLPIISVINKSVIVVYQPVTCIYTTTKFFKSISSQCRSIQFCMLLDMWTTRQKGAFSNVHGVWYSSYTMCSLLFYILYSFLVVDDDEQIIHSDI